jgi:hypothetical protein
MLTGLNQMDWLAECCRLGCCSCRSQPTAASKPSIIKVIILAKLPINYNPAVPATSQIGFGNLAFATDGTNNFKWADDLFGGRNITIHLPAINKDALIDSILNSKTDFGLTRAVRDLISINNMDIAQLSNKPGFELDGNIMVTYPPGFPKI